MVEAQARFGKIVQVGTMNRSRPAVRAAIKFMQDGGIGKVYMARGLCFKPRPSIGKYPDGPMAGRREVRAHCRLDGLRARLRRAVPVEGRLRPVARPGAEAAVQPQSLPLQLALAVGLRQRRHRQPGPAPVRHRALGPRQAGAPGQDQRPWAATSARSRRRKRRTCRRRCSSTPTARCSSLRRAASTPTTKAAQRIGNLFYGSKGWLWIDETGRRWQSYMGAVGAKNEKGPGAEPPPEAGASSRSA